MTKIEVDVTEGILDALAPDRNIQRVHNWVCQDVTTVVEQGGYQSSQVYYFCREHKSLFGPDDHRQCHAVRMVAALNMPGIRVSDFAADSVADKMERDRDA